MAPKQEPHYLELLKLTMAVRAAQKRYFKTYDRNDLRASKEVERELDLLLIEANKADNLQQDLF